MPQPMTRSRRFAVAVLVMSVVSLGAFATARARSGPPTDEQLDRKRDQAIAKAEKTWRYEAAVTAVVVPNDDPTQQARIKVKFPWLHDSEATYWARVAMPLGGGRGFYALPEVGDEVVVAFEHGDIRQPIVIGALWNGTRPAGCPPGDTACACSSQCSTTTP